MQPFKVKMSLEPCWQPFWSLLLWSCGLPCTPQSTTVIYLECCSGLSLKEVQLRLLMQAVLAHGAEPCSVLPVGPLWALLIDGFRACSCLCPQLCLRSLSPGSARAGGRGAFLPVTWTHPALQGSWILLFTPTLERQQNYLVFISHQHQPKGKAPRSCQSDIPAWCQLGSGTGCCQPRQHLGG